MQTRRPGMWWGVALEAPDPKALAHFYATLLEWPVVHEEPGTSVVGVPPAGSAFLVCQQADGSYQPPVWPPVEGGQRPMQHLDFQVGDLDGAVAEALALGAVLADEQPNPTVRVMLDPAGHPFCLCRDD